jgi:AcrR family transcriptional regulator
MILEAAIEFFAERGFAAQTRELAARLEISEPLIYRYFPTKEALVRQVFLTVIESRWDQAWASDLRDRRRSLRERLVGFYGRYLDAIDDEVWIRIVMYASLDGLDLTRRYIAGHVEEVMGVVAVETRSALHLEGELEPERLWHLQSTLIYYLVRKHIHRTPVESDHAAVVALAVDAFLSGLPGGPSVERHTDRDRTVLPTPSPSALPEASVDE